MTRTSAKQDAPPAAAPGAARPRLWPEGKRFAFTVFDDTDLASLRNVGGVYRFLEDIGMRTTKSCWVARGEEDQGAHPGQTCDDPDYLQWLLELQAKGFEIGWHGARCHSTPRDTTLAAIGKFRDLFGHTPTTMSNHTRVAEAIYWGASRLSGWRVPLYNLLTLCRNHRTFRGQVEGDPHFWGDACKGHVTYVRNFVFQDINTLRACPFMPYHDPRKPYVNYWFASSDGANVNTFCRCIGEANQDRLEQEGGACIMYTHFALNFSDGQALNPEFKRLMTRLAEKNGWFVPVATLLDRLRAAGNHQITPGERRRLEAKWLWEKIFVGTS